MRAEGSLHTQSPAKRLPQPQRGRFRVPRYTRVGKIFTGITILVSIAAFNTGNNPLYLLFGMMLSLIVLSGMVSETVLRHLHVERQWPNRIVAGQPILVAITLYNRKRHFPSFSVGVNDRISPLAEADWPGVYFLQVNANSAATAYYSHTFPQRGVWSVEGFLLSTSFPFELFRKRIGIDQPVEVVVYPQAAPPPPLPLLSRWSQGSQSRPLAGKEGDFWGLREHRSHEDIRAVHWKISAKRDQLIARELEQQDSQAITLCLLNQWDSLAARRDPSQYRQRLEQGISVAAGIAQSLVQQGYPLALVTLDGRTPFGSGAAHLDRLLEVLARLRFHGDPDYVGDPSPVHWQIQPSDRCLLMGDPSHLPSPLHPNQIMAQIPWG
ncbi:MAG: DUF58 domain-containing protein [Cyanobacteriota bacterium]|nr:DUF58 domain-containing protein [Cyanobacteriota bacterium]